MIDVNGPQAQYDAEERCLKIARTAAKHEYTKNVIREIIGDNIVEPTRSNTPLDFVIKDKNADMPVGGIEHFHVSLIYEGAEGNQLKSTAKKHEEQTKELFNKHENSSEPQELSTAFNELLLLTSDSINNRRKFDYKNYIKQFSYQTEKHFSKIRSYCETAQCSPDKVAFMIEIVVPNCAEWNTINYKTQRFEALPYEKFPITQDVINIIEKGKTQEIKYVLLVVHDEFGSETKIVYAFDVNDIETSCKAQDITIYECFAPKPLLAKIQVLY